MKELKSYTIEPPGLLGSKQWSVYGMYPPNIAAPLIYLQRPKWVTNDEKWEQIVKSVRLDLPKGFKL